jgi:hypothetical protein
MTTISATSTATATTTPHLRLSDHTGHQRGAVLLIAVGAVLALPLSPGGWCLALALGPAATPCVMAIVLGGLGAVHVGRRLSRITRDETLAPPVPRRAWFVALATLTAALMAALAAWPALATVLAPSLATLGAAVSPSPLALVDQAVAGGLFGLVASLGLLGAHLVVVDGAALESRLFAARDTLGAVERALAERAVVAHARLQRDLAGLAGDLAGGTGTAGADARRLQHTARAMTLEVLALAARSSGLATELAGVDREALTARVVELQAAAAATTDATARADFTRAARAAAELERHLHELAGAADRVRARLHLQVAALESTALALATRRASAVADRAQALAPLLERLDETSADLRAEASALAELSADPC